MVIRFRKRSVIEWMFYIIVAILPYSYLINETILRNIDIGGLSGVSTFIGIFLIFCFFDSLIQSKKYLFRKSIYVYIVIFGILNLIKIIYSNQSLDRIVSWIVANQYYIWIPFFVLSCSNTKLNYKKVVDIVCLNSIIICLISLYSFFTNNYFGLVNNEILLQYDIVGSPYIRMLSLFGSPLVAGTYFAIVLLLVHSGDFYKLIKYFLFLLNGICLLLTFSKGALIGLILGILYYYLFVVKKNVKNGIKKAIFLLTMIVGGIYLIENSFYFWDEKEILQNVRITKWIAGIEEIRKHWIIGNDYRMQISSINSFEYTLSDNSFLLSLGQYGICFWVNVYFAYYFIPKRVKTFFKSHIYLIVVIGVFFLLYDFIQMYPSNYLSIILLFSYFNLYERKK